MQVTGGQRRRQIRRPEEVRAVLRGKDLPKAGGEFCRGHNGLTRTGDLGQQPQAEQPGGELAASK